MMVPGCTNTISYLYNGVLYESGGPFVLEILVSLTLFEIWKSGRPRTQMDEISYYESGGILVSPTLVEIWTAFWKA